MQLSGTAKPPVGVLFDSSFAQTIDSVLALALLHGYTGKTQSRVAALTISYPSLQAAELCDVIEKFYTSAKPDAPNGYMQAPAIGAPEAKGKPVVVPAIAHVLGMKDATGKALWSPRIRAWSDTAVPETLLRNALDAQQDGAAVMVMDGPATNLARLLSLEGGKALIAAKVKLLVIAGGEFPEGKPEANFTADLPAIKQVLSEWPTPVTLCGREIGNQLLFPASCIDHDFAYVPVHPVAEAYRAFHAMPYDAPTWALAAMLHGIRPGDGYFGLSQPGVLSVSDDGRVQFRPLPNGKHTHLSLDPAQKDHILKTFTEMVSAKPVFPQRRRPT